MISPPRQSTGSSVVAPRATSTVTRHMLASRVVSWRGELVTTVNVHPAEQGRAPHLGLASGMPPPCPDGHRAMDSEDSTGTVSYPRAIWRGFLQTPAAAGRAPLDATVIFAHRPRTS
jgi:hypothetical protein